jgi:predicted transcriptional regulator
MLGSMKTSPSRIRGIQSVALRRVRMYSMYIHLHFSEAGSGTMSKTVTLRLDDRIYRRFRTLAERENRSLSNFIETAALRFVEGEQYVDEFEMGEIRANESLNKSIKRGLRDAKAKRGRFV